MATRVSKADQAESIAKLREWLKPGDEVWTVLRHCSESGMLRVIQVVKLEAKPPEAGVVFPIWMGYHVARALGWGYDDQREGVRVTGVGMDMGFHLIYALSWALWGEEGGHGEDAGYALKQRWL